MTDLERLKEKLVNLRLKIMAQHIEAILKEASQKNQDSLFVINQLAGLEAGHRWQNAIKLRFQQSKHIILESSVSPLGNAFLLEDATGGFISLAIAFNRYQFRNIFSWSEAVFSRSKREFWKFNWMT